MNIELAEAALREFVEDVERVGVETIITEMQWTDLVITYEHAKKALEPLK